VPRLAFVLLLIALPVMAVAEPTRTAKYAGSVVKVRAIAADGSVTLGSAVVIGTDTLATACHVTRDASNIEVSQGKSRWMVQSQVGSVSHDLCLLTVPGMGLPVLRVRSSLGVGVGERVVAVGFPGGADIVLNEGHVERLYDYEQGKVIRTSAAFDLGASGGGLFDQEGNLIGLLAFKAPRGKSLHFALPIEWTQPKSVVESALKPITGASPSRMDAFWELPKSARPSFLGAALIEASPE
jgi:serine protease Do